MIEIICIYKDEKYTARDNGEVLRHARIGKSSRKIDNQWTFGKPNDKTGYMEIASARVHRIIATAFHGEAPTKEHVVDHIDTNKRNNRPENLRWVTRLENILLNPITVKRIELVCSCKIEEFLADPSKFRDKFQEPNFKWMGTVSAEEGQLSLQRMLAWAKSEKVPSGSSLGEWIFNRYTWQNQQTEPTPDYTPSKTLNAAQRNWKTPSEFPCCPNQHSGDPIKAYGDNLRPDQIFSRNDFGSSTIFMSRISDDRQSLYVITQSKGGIKPWALAKITYENELFVHTAIGTFFTQNGAEKEYCISLGIEWTGEESIDDYC